MYVLMNAGWSRYAVLEEWKMYPRSKSILCKCLPKVSFSLWQFVYEIEPAIRINMKLGGINTVLDPESAPLLADPKSPTIVMGSSPFCFYAYEIQNK